MRKIDGYSVAHMDKVLIHDEPIFFLSEMICMQQYQNPSDLKEKQNDKKTENKRNKSTQT